MTGAELIAEILKREGVEVLPAFPHSDLIDTCAARGIRPIIVRQERHALHLADGYARATGGRKLAATTVQYGPGSENAIGAVAQCYGDNVPVLHLPGGYPRADQGTEPNFSAARAVQAYAKRAAMVPVAERIAPMLANAFAQMRNGRPGPVVLEIPIDLFTEEVDPGLLDLYRPQPRLTVCPDPDAVAALADRFKSAACPVIIAGQGVLYSGATDALVAFAEATDTPVMTTLNGKSAFPEDHPLSLGCAGGARPDAVNRFLEKGDLYLGIGTSFTRSDYITPFPVAGKTFAQVTNHEGDIGKDYPIDLAVLGDAGATLDVLLALVDRRDLGRAAEIAALHAGFLEKWRPLLTSDEVPINPYRVVHEVMQTVDRSRTVVTHDAGSPRDQVTPFYRASVPHGYMGWGKTTQLGLGMGLMQGAKLARPDWYAINIMGDAAIGMVGMDFETAVRNKIGQTVIVLKNSVMGGYSKYHPEASKRYQIEALGGDYADMARAFGGYGERVTDPAEIAPALKRALARNDAGIPALLEIITKEEPRMAKDLPAGVGDHTQV
jgi:thiamine pyrophosphate-dependent acetolactate synthase large subunit-like protein